ncbi:hypothetical protein B0O80DRAFT_451107 [Mortierella sp. GBAus27b]|nr:hypothetical protein B0O80DRAFT_451107 [Mortierella sp. GBAus27b]
MTRKKREREHQRRVSSIQRTVWKERSRGDPCLGSLARGMTNRSETETMAQNGARCGIVLRVGPSGKDLSLFLGGRQHQSRTIRLPHQTGTPESFLFMCLGNVEWDFLDLTGTKKATMDRGPGPRLAGMCVDEASARHKNSIQVGFLVAAQGRTTLGNRHWCTGQIHSRGREGECGESKDNAKGVEEPMGRQYTSSLPSSPPSSASSTQPGARENRQE